MVMIWVRGEERAPEKELLPLSASSTHHTHPHTQPCCCRAVCVGIRLWRNSWGSRTHARTHARTSSPAVTPGPGRGGITPSFPACRSGYLFARKSGGGRRRWRRRRRPSLTFPCFGLLFVWCVVLSLRGPCVYALCKESIVAHSTRTYQGPCRGSLAAICAERDMFVLRPVFCFLVANFRLSISRARCDQFFLRTFGVIFALI
ncbi:hypothetical protein B0J12DRAFT_304517 [Macrophomina phaseolina]|uniref:Uncharacterized protein n=1 Tax=Macrophomina phaseolina TaxID=35725 RepID=A0ABQ8FXC6_9PEZI|nr:hypothetical protein B0J12DRAFT_304517 [Macrophomina phaseolina]